MNTLYEKYVRGENHRQIVRHSQKCKFPGWNVMHSAIISEKTTKKLHSELENHSGCVTRPVY